MDSFVVGEVAIFYRPISSCHRNEVEILGPLELHEFLDEVTGKEGKAFAYRISNPGPSGDHDYIAEPYELRKRPPKEDARKWFDEKIKLNPKVLEEA